MEDAKKENDLRVLTIDELRSFDGFEKLSDQEVLKIITTLKEVSLLVHKLL
ncbi:hypothetical protein [Aquimarina longa]|uniref:hypothetical protein n=1 Tax=Aquimarina longa TaxID=1080221 RepID=UPI000ABDCD94|nr:hypothetical protein [Aquimarina longa]